MFERFPNRWTPVLPLTELTSNPVAAELAGERIVLFRGEGKDWHALLDRCPHRGAALSLGDITPDGELRCRYHGWRYDGRGRCTMVPLNELNDAARDKIRATALPTRRIAGAIWVYTATRPLAGATPEPMLPKSLRGKPGHYITYHQEWDAHWTRAQTMVCGSTHGAYSSKRTTRISCQATCALSKVS